MAKRKKRKKRVKHNLRKGQCKIITIRGGGKRKLCKDKRGRVKFRKLSYSPR